MSIFGDRWLATLLLLLAVAGADGLSFVVKAMGLDDDRKSVLGGRWFHQSAIEFAAELAMRLVQHQTLANGSESWRMVIMPAVGVGH